MRLIIFISILGSLSCAALNSRHTTVTSDELHGFGDFNGDNLLDALVIDRRSGLYRIGIAQANGSLLWSAAKSTGCQNPASLAVGAISSTADSFAVTSPSANQVHLIDPTTPYSRPSLITPTGIGTTSVAAVDVKIPGNDPALLDLLVTSHWNSPPTAYQRDILQSLPTGISPASNINTNHPLDRASRVLLESGTDEIFATFERLTSSNNFNLTDTGDPSLPLLSSVSGLPVDSDFLHASFLEGTKSQFIFYRPGTPGISISSWTGSILTSPQPKSISPMPVLTIGLVHDGTSYGIAVIYNDGDLGELFTFDTSGNPVSGGIITPPPGEKLKGILATSPGHFASLSGMVGSGSTTTTPHSHDGNKWNAETAETLPALSGSTSRANVFLYDKEPIVNPDAKLVETLHIPDWTSSFAITGSGNDMHFTMETFSGESDGLSATSATVIPNKLATANDALLNQAFPEVSLSSTDSQLGAVPIQISIAPAGGSYTRYITPELRVPDTTDITAYFRTNDSSAWSSYTFGTPIPPPGDTLKPFTVWFYAQQNSSGRRSPIYRADYHFAGDPGSLDSDADGVPDFVEIAHGLDPLGNADSDEDSLSDLEELLLGSDPANGSETASYGSETLELPPSRSLDRDGDGISDFTEWASGSDPFDSNSTPTSSSLIDFQNNYDLDIRPLSHSGIIDTLPDRQSFRSEHPDFSSTDLRAYDISGQLLGFATTRKHPSPSLLNPYAHLPSIPASGRDLFSIIATPTSFDCVQDADLPHRGRELIGLIPIPTLEIEAVPFAGTATSIAADWVAAAQSHYASLPQPLVSTRLRLNDTLIYLLWERIVGIKLHQRNTLTSELPLGLSGFRDTLPNDGSQQSQSASPSQLLSLQSFVDSSDSGYLLHHLEEEIRATLDHASDPRVQAIKKLANEIYRISAALSDADPGLYPSPFETLRQVIRELPAESSAIDGLIPLPGDSSSSYGLEHTLTSEEITDADGSLAFLLSQLTPRSTQSFTAVVTDSTFSTPVPILEDTDSASSLRLFTADGSPFVFPESIDLPSGTRLEILAFTDRSNLPAGTGTALEAITATITGFPHGNPQDRNQNAIDDEFENYFFGGPTEPFADADGDGYINLQEALDGSHPNDPASTPNASPLPAAMPPVRVSRSGGQLHFTLEFPSSYGDQLHFLLQSSGTQLSLPFNENLDAATTSGNNSYTLSIPLPAANSGFFRFRLGLRP